MQHITLQFINHSQVPIDSMIENQKDVRNEFRPNHRQERCNVNDERSFTGNGDPTHNINSQHNSSCARPADRKIDGTTDAVKIINISLRKSNSNQRESTMEGGESSIQKTMDAIQQNKEINHIHHLILPYSFKNPFSKDMSIQEEWEYHQRRHRQSLKEVQLNSKTFNNHIQHHSKIDNLKDSIQKRNFLSMVSKRLPLTQQKLTKKTKIYAAPSFSEIAIGRFIITLFFWFHIGFWDRLCRWFPLLVGYMQIYLSSLILKIKLLFWNPSSESKQKSSARSSTKSNATINPNTSLHANHGTITIDHLYNLKKNLMKDYNIQCYFYFVDSRSELLQFAWNSVPFDSKSNRNPENIKIMLYVTLLKRILGLKVESNYTFISQDYLKNIKEEIVHLKSLLQIYKKKFMTLKSDSREDYRLEDEDRTDCEYLGSDANFDDSLNNLTLPCITESHHIYILTDETHLKDEILSNIENLTVSKLEEFEMLLQTIRAYPRMQARSLITMLVIMFGIFLIIGRKLLQIVIRIII